MNNKNINITELIRKYEQMRYMNKKVYFDADEFGLLAKYYKDNKKISEAESVINLGLGMHSNSFELKIIKAKVLLASKQYEIAYDYLITIAHSEANVVILIMKFDCLLKLDRTEEADAYLDYILEGELNDGDLNTFVKEVGYLYNDAECFETAIMLLEKAMKVDTTNMDILVELAYAYEMDDNIVKAIEITNVILDLDPYSFDGWVSMGRLHSYNYEYELSIDAFDFALAIKESDVNVLKLKALTYNQDDNYEAELKLLNECIDASPDDESLYDDLLEKYKEFEVYWGIEQDEGIVKVLEKKEARFGSKELLLKIAHHYVRLDKYDEAKEAFQRIPDEYKHTLEYYKLTGDFALHNSDYAAAEAAFMLAYLESPIDKDVLDILAEINSDLNNYEKSAEYLEQLIAVDSEYSVAKFRLAFIRFEIGEKEPFDEIINQVSDEELRILLNMFKPIKSKDKTDEKELSREELIIRLDEARVNRVLLKKDYIK